MAADLKVPVNDPVGFKVVVVLPERVDQLLRHLMSRRTSHDEHNFCESFCNLPPGGASGSKADGDVAYMESVND